VALVAAFAQQRSDVGVEINGAVALHVTDRLLVNSGVTCEFHSLSLDDAEFGVRNEIDVASRVNFIDAACTQAPMRQASNIALPRRSAVLIGGGKDSLVSVEALRKGGEPLVLFAVNPKKPILDCVVASDLPFARVERHLDPLLFELNAKGALNGHVPITAIVSFIAVAASFVEGFDALIKKLKKWHRRLLPLRQQHCFVRPCAYSLEIPKDHQIVIS
jgi:hypothetical protein